MIVKIPLERVYQNPFQTRQLYTEIEELADSIKKMKSTRPETCGLMQVATARVVKANGRDWEILNPDDYGYNANDGTPLVLEDEPEAVVQIAFAHRRLRAFALLAESDPDYGAFPVELVQLDDKQMSDLAWEENAKRKDLTAIEEGEALQAAMAMFGYSQEEIGRRWGLSQSAVANKIRLLKLPAEAQEAIRTGQITERHGRALLTALGKSKAIYERAAAEIIPVIPEDPAAIERAKELTDQHTFWVQNFVQGSDKPVTCAGCDVTIQPGEPRRLRTMLDGDIHLCLTCYHVATHLHPPSAAEAEDLVKQTVQRESTPLSGAKFPIEEPFLGEGIVSHKCENCPARQDDKCFDKGCFEKKAKIWMEIIVKDFKERLQRDYGADPEEVVIVDGYGGHDLDRREVDREMVAKGGPCAPGQCKRLQFKIRQWESSTDIKVYSDLPFIFQCNHTGAHTAAQRRYLESQRPAEEKSEEVRKAEAAAEQKGRGKEVYVQAVSSLAMALGQGELGAWRALVKECPFNAEVDTIEAVWQRFAEKLLEGERDKVFSKDWQYIWERDNAVESYRDDLEKKLARWGVARLPQLDDIREKLDRIISFVYGRRIDGEITPEQIEGNRVNLEKQVCQIKELLQAGLAQSPEVIPLLNQVQEAMDELWEAAGDIGYEVPTDWGISQEMSLADLNVLVKEKN